MKDRRPLVAGLNSGNDIAEDVAKEFIYGNKIADTESTAAEEVKNATPENRIMTQMTGRVPITTRARPEIASALKRASLQRQLDGIEPYYVQDIMEEALEAWLSKHGIS